MRHKQKYITPLLAALAAAAIATAPIAAAAPSATQSCTSSGSTQTDCQSPGNAQIYVAPPQVDYFTYRGGAT